MKIEVELDIDAIAKAVAKINGKPAGKPAGKPKAQVEDETETETETDTETETEEDFGEGETETPEVSKADVLEALKSVTKKHDQDTAMEILKKTGGVNALSKLKEDKYAAVLAACKRK